MPWYQMNNVGFSRLNEGDSLIFTFLFSWSYFQFVLPGLNVLSKNIYPWINLPVVDHMYVARGPRGGGPLMCPRRERQQHSAENDHRSPPPSAHVSISGAKGEHLNLYFGCWVQRSRYASWLKLSRPRRWTWKYLFGGIKQLEIWLRFMTRKIFGNILVLQDGT